jgi:hypothetical protein
MASVVETQSHGGADGGGNGREHVGTDGGSGAVSGRHRHHRAVQGGDPVAQPRRKHLLHFGQRAQRRFLDPGDAASRVGLQTQRDGYRLVVIEQQRG